MVKKKRINKKPILVMVVILMLISLGSFYIASTHQNDVEAYQVEGLPIQHQFSQSILILEVESLYIVSMGLLFIILQIPVQPLKTIETTLKI